MFIGNDNTNRYGAFVPIRFYENGIKDLLLINNYCEKTRGFGINISGENSCHRMIIKNNKMIDCYGGIGLNNPVDTGIRTSASEFIIENNYIQLINNDENTKFCIDLAGTSNVIINNNILKAASQSTYSQCIHLEDDSSDVVISNNILIQDNENNLNKSWLISLANSQNVNIFGNHFLNLNITGEKQKGILAGD